MTDHRRTDAVNDGQLGHGRNSLGDSVYQAWYEWAESTHKDLVREDSSSSSVPSIDPLAGDRSSYFTIQHGGPRIRFATSGQKIRWVNYTLIGMAIALMVVPIMTLIIAPIAADATYHARLDGYTNRWLEVDPNDSFGLFELSRAENGARNMADWARKIVYAIGGVLLLFIELGGVSIILGIRRMKTITIHPRKPRN